MNRKEFQKRKSEIRSLFESGDTDLAKAEALELVDELHADKKYTLTTELYHSRFFQPKEFLWTFEVAYALNEQGEHSEPVGQLT